MADSSCTAANNQQKESSMAVPMVKEKESSTAPIVKKKKSTCGKCGKKYKKTSAADPSSSASASTSTSCRNCEKKKWKRYRDFKLKYHLQGVDKEAYCKYRKQIDESEGFGIIDYPGHCRLITIIPWSESSYHPIERIENLSINAIEKFNRKREDKYEFDKVIRVNLSLVSGTLYYITFQARKVGADPTDPVVTFQAKVYVNLRRTETQVVLCRIV